MNLNTPSLMFDCTDMWRFTLCKLNFQHILATIIINEILEGLNINQKVWLMEKTTAST